MIEILLRIHLDMTDTFLFIRVDHTKQFLFGTELAFATKMCLFFCHVLKKVNHSTVN